ncbi:alpha/beta hydrolase [Cryobacterium cryoconiti]|uniref:DUF1023 domain-containing protein n=1 Tax=Cryobacterium cryoconiti TaxID=1259239 RepID=A0A4Y8JXF5_9MICO|nr:alpha/beta hydrolase [Cryobacterium cryoconiti]TFD32237.1 hypothetical protein E3T49_04545 [Cryobacterium cryoconiti]
MGHHIGMDPDEVEGRVAVLRSQIAELDGALTTMRRAREASANPLGYGLLPGSPILAPWALAGLAVAAAQVKSARVHAEELVNRLAGEIAQQRAASDGGAIASAAGHPASQTPAAALAAYAGDPTADPVVVAAWWRALSEEEQRALVVGHPELVGNLEGVDYTSRSEANRAELDRQIGIAEASGDDEDLDYLQSVKTAVGQHTQSVYQLISFTAGPPPLAAISVGNLDTAAYATFLAPGMGSNSAGTPQDLTAAARDLYVEERSLQVARGLTGGVAVVAWMAYDAPEMASLTDLDVFKGERASEGAVVFERALLGYDASYNAGPGHEDHGSFLSVDAHSYGSTMAADALADIPEGIVDAFVAIGSAGIATSIGGADGLNVPDGSVYAIQAYESLPAAGLGLLGSGREGAYWESFGAERLSSDHQIVDERETSVTNVHDLQMGEDSWLFNGYLDRNTTSLNNAALVNLGLGDEASRG